MQSSPLKQPKALQSDFGQQSLHNSQSGHALTIFSPHSHLPQSLKSQQSGQRPHSLHIREGNKHELHISQSMQAMVLQSLQKPHPPGHVISFPSQLSSAQVTSQQRGQPTLPSSSHPSQLRSRPQQSGQRLQITHKRGK